MIRQTLKEFYKYHAFNELIRVKLRISDLAIICVPLFRDKTHLNKQLVYSYYKKLKSTGLLFEKIDVTHNKNFDGHALFYVARDKKIITESKSLGTDQKSMIQFGRLLGYPKCCIKSFVDFKSSPYETKRRTMELKLMSLKKNKKLHIVFNPFLQQISSYNVLSHEICKYPCKKSIKLGEEILDAMKNHDPDYYRDLRVSLESKIILTGYKYGEHLMLHDSCTGFVLPDMRDNKSSENKNALPLTPNQNIPKGSRLTTSKSNDMFPIHIRFRL